MSPRKKWTTLVREYGKAKRHSRSDGSHQTIEEMCESIGKLTGIAQFRTWILGPHLAAVHPVVYRGTRIARTERHRLRIEATRSRIEERLRRQQEKKQ